MTHQIFLKIYSSFANEHVLNNADCEQNLTIAWMNTKKGVLGILVKTTLLLTYHVSSAVIGRNPASSIFRSSRFRYFDEKMQLRSITIVISQQDSYILKPATKCLIFLNIWDRSSVACERLGWTHSCIRSFQKVLESLWTLTKNEPMQLDLKSVSFYKYQPKRPKLLLKRRFERDTRRHTADGTQHQDTPNLF